MLRMLVVMAVTLLAADSDVTLLHSWENDAEKWKGISGFSATGATEGEHAAVRAVPPKWNNELQSGYSAELREKLKGNRCLAVDITLATAPPPGAVLKITPQIILQGDVVNTDTKLGARPIAAGTHTLTWDYSAYGEAIDGATGWAHVRFITEAYGYPEDRPPGDVHLDYLRASKEAPATAAEPG